MMGAEWSVSASEESCQWTVLPNNTWDDLGSHTSCVGVMLLLCTVLNV